ncbi:protein Wnt-11b-2 [Cryptotermes secundus]|uniref:protein Wnt-11b-2 n=1 Tax=Cryptotermes secundus TaxID=105785 RepID=UPI000CD7CCD4|nr:protein Wnt-11b-2 [Cryptotermes secundus]XP_033608302.1 protein Wnt-11b-2 [Cryptotermes secundus]XP_033608303.1 protein Wnt-11b-2 [Cryptotermes secundus]
MSRKMQLLVVLLLIVCWLDQADTIRWLALKKTSFKWNATGAASAMCRKARLQYGLARRQTKLCRTSTQTMPHIAKAAAQTVTTCQSVFADRRWNCSSVEMAPSFTPDITTGTREQAYVYALSSAAVVYTIARACAAGTLFHCACASPPRDPPNGNFKWGGCGDNVRWGSQFGKQFTDSAEKRGARTEPRYNSRSTTERESGRHRGGRRKRKGGEDDMKPPLSPFFTKNRFRSALAAVNLHNNRAGRRAVESSLVTQCKCHGVSGSCNIKTCWRALPTLSEIGERLKRKFTVATEVISRRVGAGRKLLPASSAMGLYNEDDLIYVTKSPDYCLRDARVGSLGTRGRSCNTSSHGYDSCEDMCCGRGYSTISVEKVERCQCKYHWCCYVQCKICRRWVDTQECN